MREEPKERDSLKSKLAVAVEALKYYGVGEGRHTFYGPHGPDVSTMVGVDWEGRYSGDRAREALKAINGGE